MMVICHRLRRWRGRTGFLVACALVIGSFVLAHSAFTGGHEAMASHGAMSDAATVCLFLAEAGALALGLSLAARARGRGWPLRRAAGRTHVAPSALLLTDADPGGARAGPARLQVFRL